MKLIEALKETKDLERQVASLNTKIGTHCALLSNEGPEYGNDQANTVRQWIQGAHDRIKRIEFLRLSINHTNMVTPVTIELGGKPVVKSIAAWILRRRELAQMELRVWSNVNDRRLRPTQIQTSTGEKVDVTVVRYFSSTERDDNIEMFTSEPSIVDGRLEIVNALTDLIDVPNVI